MIVDKNDFFHQATMRICGSLNIETALWRCLDYIEKFIPVTGVHLHLYDKGLETMRSIAQVSRDKTKKFETIMPVPDEARKGLKRDRSKTQIVKMINRPELDPVTRSMTSICGKSSPPLIPPRR